MLKHIPNTLTIIRFLLIPFIVLNIFDFFLPYDIIFIVFGVWPSGKASDSDSDYRRFESYYLSHRKNR